MKQFIKLCLLMSLVLISLRVEAEETEQPLNEEEEVQPTENIEEETKVPEKILPSINDEKIASLVKGNNAFALQLYGRLRSTSGNILFSPYSISSALAMTYAGAEGSTAEEMKNVLHYPLDHPDLDAAFAWLNRTFTTYTSDFGADFRVLNANSLWVQTGQNLLPEFLQIMTDYFQANIRQVDFAFHSEIARSSINRWVKDRTQGRIVDIIQPNDLSRTTRLVLVSALYMKARWANLFDLQLTQQAPFFPALDRSITVPMMQTTGSFLLYQGDTASLIELPYAPPRPGGLQLAFLILLPNERMGLSNIERTLTLDQYQKWKAQMTQKRVNVIMPKFTISESFTLNDALQSLGIKAAFTTQADFSRLANVKDLYIGKVVHKTFMNVNEKGTEATAATAITMNRTAVQQIPVLFRADHPFLFMIVEKGTGSILFMGRLNIP